MSKNSESKKVTTSFGNKLKITLIVLATLLCLGGLGGGAFAIFRAVTRGGSSTNRHLNMDKKDLNGRDGGSNEIESESTQTLVEIQNQVSIPTTTVTTVSISIKSIRT